jgi:hypothetical protein
MLGLDPAGHVLLAGDLVGGVDFGTGKLQSTPNGASLFLAKLAP